MNSHIKGAKFVTNSKKKNCLNHWTHQKMVKGTEEKLPIKVERYSPVLIKKGADMSVQIPYRSAHREGA